MSQGESDLRDFTKFDKRALKEIASKAEAKTDELIRITESVLAAKGTDRINPEIAKAIALIFDNKKALSDFIPPGQPKINGICLRRQGFGRKSGLSVVVYMRDERLRISDQLGQFTVGGWSHRKNIEPLCFLEDEIDVVYETDEMLGIMRF